MHFMRGKSRDDIPGSLHAGITDVGTIFMHRSTPPNSLGIQVKSESVGF